ncbi:MAG: hypothetical protein ACYC4R_09720 [Anaerolineae bacterium]
MEQVPNLVAFASLPFGVRGGQYEVATKGKMVVVHVSDLRFNPFLSISSRPELIRALPSSGQGQGFVSYTWYDHPFVLRVLFGHNVASLGSINSLATILQPLPEAFDLRDEGAISALRGPFAEVALEALNNLVAVVRRRARLYHVHDLRRDDIDISVRREDGIILLEDPLQAALTREEVEESERFDLVQQSPEWYNELNQILREPEPVSLADDLMMEAERTLSQRFPRQAIATCHTALETAVSALLTRGMSRRGIPDKEIDEILSTRGLASKFDSLLRQYTGYSLKQSNHALWKSFNLLNDLRNDIAHRGKQPTEEDAAFAIAAVRDLLAWLALVRHRGTPDDRRTTT